MNITAKPLLGRFCLGRPGAAVRVPAGALLVLTGLVLSACATSPAAGRGTHRPPAADVALVRFSSCGDALRNLRAAATSAIAAGASAASSGTSGPDLAAAAPPTGATASASGLQSGSYAPSAAVAAHGPASLGGVGQVGAAAPGSYSGTNTATVGVDEPDLIKTDGRRIGT